MEEEYSDLDLDQMADALLESDINEPNLPEKKKQPMVNSLMNIQSYDNTPEYIRNSQFDLAYMEAFDIPGESTGFMGTHNQQYLKEYHKEYSQRPEVKQRIKEYNQKPEVIQYKKEYFKNSPIIKNKLFNENVDKYIDRLNKRTYRNYLKEEKKKNSVIYRST